MSRKDEFEFDLPSRKEKKERPQREEKESKPLFGEGSFLGGLFKKSASFEDSSLDDEAFFDKEKNGDNGKIFKRLKWWHILIATLGIVIVIAAIVASILIGSKNNNDSNNGENVDDTPIIEGEITSIGTFLFDEALEYILCEYTEYFSGKNMTIVHESSDIPYDYQPYWVFVNEIGQHSKTYKGKLSDSSNPEEIKEQVMAMMSNAAGYTPEKIALCDVHVYNPVSFTRVTISEVTLTETEVTVKYSAGAVDGEMSEEYTLTGTYTKADNDYTFTYTNLPEDENLLRVAESLLGSAKYESYAQYGAWVNELTFGDNYKLTLISPTAEE